MKILAWYSAVILGIYELYFINELFFGNEQSLYFFVTAMFTPILVFVLKYLIKNK